jgi:lethal(2) giant larvae protein
MNIVLDRDGFVWKGHDQLTPRSGTLSLAPGFQPHSLLQLHPPAAITALVLHAEWGLVAAGTAHGLALFDYIRHKGVLTKCTLNPNGKLYKYMVVLKFVVVCHWTVHVYVTAVWCCYQCTRR